MKTPVYRALGVVSVALSHWRHSAAIADDTPPDPRRLFLSPVRTPSGRPGCWRIRRPVPPLRLARPWRDSLAAATAAVFVGMISAVGGWFHAARCLRYLFGRHWFAARPGLDGRVPGFRRSTLKRSTVRACAGYVPGCLGAERWHPHGAVGAPCSRHGTAHHLGGRGPTPRRPPRFALADLTHGIAMVSTAARSSGYWQSSRQFRRFVVLSASLRLRRRPRRNDALRQPDAVSTALSASRLVWSATSWT